MATLAEIAEKVNGLVKDSTGTLKDPADYHQAIDNAADIHTRNVHPLAVVSYDGVTDQLLYDLPDDWVESISEVDFKVEYPVNNSAEQVQVLSDDMVDLYATPTGTKIRFRSNGEMYLLPKTGETFRLHYRVKFLASPSGCNIPDGHLVPFCKLAASELCKTIAAATSGNGTSSIDGGISAGNSSPYWKLSVEYKADYDSIFNPRDGTGARVKAKMGTFRTTPLSRNRMLTYVVNPSK